MDQRSIAASRWRSPKTNDLPRRARIAASTTSRYPYQAGAYQTAFQTGTSRRRAKRRHPPERHPRPPRPARSSVAGRGYVGRAEHRPGRSGVPHEKTSNVPAGLVSAVDEEEMRRHPAAGVGVASAILSERERTDLNRSRQV